jgi:hypothetical protein
VEAEPGVAAALPCTHKSHIDMLQKWK